MIGYYNYTVILTYIGTVSGLLGIMSILRGNAAVALFCLIFAGLCDMFDGKVASTMERTRQEKKFGIQIDSLSDVICFGVLPALIVYFVVGETIVAAVTSSVYLLCALIRLAWFNVDEEERQGREDGCRKVYLGLPVTTSALLVPFFMGIGGLLKVSIAFLYPWFLLLIAAAFITPFHIKKPKLVGKIIMIVIGAACLAVVIVGLLGGKI
ncbi:MAG: CDP-alcohol phosphatidyltransferase family protein [Clostridia bacterium]|nr:CDP-alcohol phosphatidyltransferase family protein [Clostridia bacterium]